MPKLDNIARLRYRPHVVLRKLNSALVGTSAKLCLNTKMVSQCWKMALQYAPLKVKQSPLPIRMRLSLDRFATHDA